MAKKTHSKNFEKVKEYYPLYWNINRVKKAFVGGWITAEEYEEITGEPYEE